MGLYTYDIDLDGIEDPPLSETLTDLSFTSYSKHHYKDEWTQHPDLATTWGIDHEFLNLFSRGFECYRDGLWMEAKRVLEECQWSRKNAKNKEIEDGPSSTLLQYMKSFNFCAPDDWPGYRELVEK